MANPTTNYGFVLPTSTDLVTDLPADFDVALQGVDTRLKALNPETTLGDIAYQSATANTKSRLPIGTNGQVLAVSGGVPAWTTTADVTPLTTKGDLFTFTTQDARLGVGANGTVLTADSAEATGMKWAAPGAGFVGCRAYATSDQTMNNGANVMFNLDSENYDTNGFHSTTTNNSRITIPSGKAGYYLITGVATYQGGSAGQGQRDLYVQLNGTTGLVNVVSQRVSNLNFLGMSLSDVQYLAVGDYIELGGYQDSGTSASTFTQGSRRVFLAVQYLGA
jgi:hypothetical protein